MFKSITFIVCLLGLGLKSNCAFTEEDKRALISAYKPMIAECSQTHGVSSHDLQTAKQTANTSDISACFFGCAFKKLEIINNEGKVDIVTALSKLKRFLRAEEDYFKFEEIAHRCASVNDEAVSDGDAGCERAQMLLKCFLQNKAELPL